MFINRKNDGTVKMTRQRAKPYHSGMTGDDNALGRYLEMGGKPTPKQSAAERLHQLQQETHVTRLQSLWVSKEAPGHGVQDFWPLPGIGHDLPGYRLKLFCGGNSYAWVEQVENTVRVSYTYPSKERALKAKYETRIGWIHKFDLD
jgi:hypothetical protein